MFAITIGEWVVYCKEIIAYRDTGIVNTWQTIDVLLKSGVTLSGKLKEKDFSILQNSFEVRS